MKKTLIAGIALMTIALPAMAQQVSIDYDRWARFTTFKTFAWHQTEETSLLGVSEMMHQRIKGIIIEQFSSGRLKFVEEDPDLYVTYHTSARESLRLDTLAWGYGFPSNWYWDPYSSGSIGMSTTNVRTYTQGILIIDVWDAKEKTLVWRGSTIATVTQNPEKNTKKIEKGVKKLAKKWQKMKPGF
jgi:hypothetical protein